MKRSLIAATILSLVFAFPVFAVESNPPANAPPKGPSLTFDQKKAQILKNLDERSTKLQEERACVQAAKSDEDLKACRKKLMPPHGPFGPAGPGRPGGSGGAGGSPTPQNQ